MKLDALGASVLFSAQNLAECLDIPREGRQGSPGLSLDYLQGLWRVDLRVPGDEIDGGKEFPLHTRAAKIHRRDDVAGVLQHPLV